jgi:hypothetical protein
VPRVVEKKPQDVELARKLGLIDQALIEQGSVLYGELPDYNPNEYFRAPTRDRGNGYRPDVPTPRDRLATGSQIARPQQPNPRDQDQPRGDAISERDDSSLYGGNLRGTQFGGGPDDGDADPPLSADSEERRKRIALNARRWMAENVNLTDGAKLRAKQAQNVGIPKRPGTYLPPEDYIAEYTKETLVLATRAAAAEEYQGASSEETKYLYRVASRYVAADSLVEK